MLPLHAMFPNLILTWWISIWGGRGADFVPQGRLAMSGDVSGCHDWGWVLLPSSGQKLNSLSAQGGPITKNDPAPKVHSPYTQFHSALWGQKSLEESSSWHE